MANPAEKIFDHSWLDPECIEAGCKSLILKHECRTRAEAQVDLADLLAAEKRKVSLLRAALVAAQKHIGNGYQPPEIMDQIEKALAI